MPKCLKCGALIETLGNCPKCPPTVTRPPQVRPLMREELKSTGRAPSSLPPKPRTPSGIARPAGAPAIGVRASAAPPRVAANGAAPASAVSSIIQNPASKPSTTQRVPPTVNASVSPPARAATPAKVVPPAQTRVAPTQQPRPRAVPQRIPDPLDQDPAELLFHLPERTVAETAAVANEVRVRPAGVFRRVLAWLVDAILVLTVVAVYLRVATLILGTKVLAMAYAAAFAVLRAGATPGRSLMRIRLIDRNGASPSPARTIFRAILSCVSFASFLGGIWLALFDRRGQTLHDRLTSTFVVRLH